MGKVPQIELAPDLKISRILTGLWQIADIERKDPDQDLKALAKAMSTYSNAGLRTFDMADHYGSFVVLEHLGGEHEANEDGSRQVWTDRIEITLLDLSADVPDDAGIAAE